MRVLHVLTRAYRRGAETFGLTLHEQLLARGVVSEVRALAPAPPGHDRLDVPVLGLRPRQPATLLALRRAAAGVDVVIAHGSTTLPACWLALWRSSTPFVYVNIGDPLHWTASRSRRLRVRWMLAGAAAVGAITATAARRLVDHVGVDPAKVTVTGNGRRAADYLPASSAERAAARDRFGLPSNAPVAAVVAALSPEKRVDVAVEAAGHLPNLHLLVAGDGPLRNELTTQAARLAPGRVQFLGSVRDVRAVYAAADLLLLTSDTEGLPGVLIEAGLMGLPTVATDVGFVSDVVRNGVTGRLITPGDGAAAAAAVGDTIGAPDMGAAARRHCLAEHELDRVTDRWLDVLQRVRRQ